MCGIAGIVGPQAALGGQQLVAAMNELQRHRGPDDVGLFAAAGVVLGHRRLSILDPSDAGHQPMRHRNAVIVYNGEIYNFPELRRQHPGNYRSASDTEMLLHLWNEEGEACLDRLHGMFAFGLWEEDRQRLVLARDRLGIKPLHYRFLEGGSLAFASEIKALVDLAPVTVDPLAVRDLFTYKYIPTPKTIYREIHKLPPAHTLVWQAGSGDAQAPNSQVPNSQAPNSKATVELRRYWSPQIGPAHHDLEAATAELETLLGTVVGEHCLSDVPIGVFLSGGIDSSLIASFLPGVRAFTLGFDIASHDEAEIAGQVAAALHVPHRVRQAGGVDLEVALEKMPQLYDEPFADHGAWAMHLVAQLAAEEVKVALTGEGGDELFGGYHWYRKIPQQRARVHHHVAAAVLPPLSAGGRAAQRRLATGLERYAMFLGPFNLQQKRALLSDELLELDHDDLWHYRHYWREDLPLLQRVQWADLHTYLADDMLTKVDRATMACSLEARPPLVDHRIVEWALALPEEMLSDGTHGKLPLRSMLAKRVPRHLWDRPKIGFSMPVRRWCRQRPELLEQALRRLHRADVLRSPRVHPHTNEQTFCLLMLDRFLQQAGYYRGVAAA